MLWEEEQGRLIVCGGSSWRQVFLVSILVVNVIAIAVNIAIVNIILCDLTFDTRSIQPATAGRPGIANHAFGE